jgi:glycerate 2-kinase
MAAAAPDRTGHAPRGAQRVLRDGVAEARSAREVALDLFRAVAAAVDGEALIRDAGATADLGAVIDASTHVLAVGKAALPMLAGARARAGARPALAIAPQARVPVPAAANVDLRVADHPLPSARSVEAAAAARAFVAARAAGDRLLVLLSGGASSLLAAPAPPLSLADKRALVAAVARGGAPIGALNAVRKHLSAIKGGRLALATSIPIAVVCLSDVVGDDPATIGSGPFSGDPSRYANALAAVADSGAASDPATAPARAYLEAGARGEHPETPEPGDPRLDHVSFHVVAGPAYVAEEARRAAARAGLDARTLWRDTESDVAALATLVLERVARERMAGAPARARVYVGNGEPVIRLPENAGRGGRATHLGLLVARGLAALPEDERGRIAFLAAGTDDRDGSAPASGAVVDGWTFGRSATRGVDPEVALRAYDSAAALEAAGGLVIGPGTSNVLDLHLLVVT